MPNKSTHQFITGTVLALSSPVLVCSFTPETGAVLAGVALTLVPVLTPDMDISHRKFSWLEDFLGFRIYAKQVGHRAGLRRDHWRGIELWHIAAFSHVPWLGTAPRAILVLAPLMALLLLVNIWPATLVYFGLFLWLGMGWSDLWHVVADIIYGDWKTMKREFWTRRRYFGRRAR